MDKTKALLALAVLGLVAVALALVTSWPDAAESLVDTGPEQVVADDSAPEVASPVSAEEGRAPGAETETREEIATGRSQAQRQVRLQFRCETLKSNVAGVWRFMGLTIRIEDKAGQHLALCKTPSKAQIVSLPVDVERIAAHEFDDAALVPRDRGIDKVFAVCFERSQRARLVFPHQSGVADHVCGQNGGSVTDRSRAGAIWRRKMRRRTARRTAPQGNSRCRRVWPPNCGP